VKKQLGQSLPNGRGSDSASEPRPLGSGRLLAEIQRIAWENCGIVRSADGLREAAVQLEALSPQSPEERSMRQVALLIARCALARQESRGAHYRTDYPETREAFARHSVVAREADVTFR
jgi:L-aspartate oxidase